MPGVVASHEPVARRLLAASQELVESDVQTRSQVKQGVERKAPPTALGLRDRARRDSGEVCELALAEAARAPELLERRAEPGRGGRGLERRPAVLELVPVHAALHARWPALGLDDAQTTVADAQDA